MYLHKQELHFKATPEKPDAVYARKLQEVLGGQYGEITVALQYSFQAWNMHIPGKYRDLVYASIHGMMRTLDPHTNFLQPSAFSNMREKQQASFFGLGILVGIRNGRLTVITPIDGTPASRLGIRAGDVI